MESNTKGPTFLEVLKAEDYTHKKTHPKKERGLSKLTWRCSWTHKIIAVHTGPNYRDLKFKSTAGIKQLMTGVTNVLNTNIWSNAQHGKTRSLSLY